MEEGREDGRGWKGRWGYARSGVVYVCSTYSPVHVLDLLVPREMPHDVEQPAGRRSALLEVVVLSRIDLTLPEVGVPFRDEPIVDARELAVYVEDLGRRDARVSLRFGIKDPAHGRAGEFVPLGDVGGGRVFRREEEEDVAICEGEVEDDLAVVGFVGASDMAMESCEASTSACAILSLLLPGEESTHHCLHAATRYPPASHLSLARYRRAGPRSDPTPSDYRASSAGLASTSRESWEG